MVTLKKESLVIVIEDTSPAERREWLIDALAAMLRNYAINPEKRFEDNEHAAVIADLVMELNKLDNATQQ